VNDNNNDNPVIDVDSYGAAQPLASVSYSGGTDTITFGDIDSLTSSSMTTITLPNTLSNVTYQGATVGGINSINTTGVGYHNPTWSTGTNYTINSGFNSHGTSTVQINTDGIEMAAGTDIKVDGQSLKEFMKKMEQRLAILVPNPAKLEKFEALKKAYEHYKTMESLCFDEPKEEDQ
jgi:hypothetical protein